MFVEEQPQVMQALAKAQEVRLAALREREALRGKPCREIVEALIDPTPALASMRLDKLFAGTGGGLIPRFGQRALASVLADLSDPGGVGRQRWHERLRLRELTRRERQLFARAVVKRAPKAWREST